VAASSKPSSGGGSWLVAAGPASYPPVAIQVKENEEFRLLPPDQLIEIISSDDLNVRSEEHVYKAVMTWVKHDVVERRPLLPKVRSLLPPNALIVDCIVLLFFIIIYLVSSSRSLSR